MRKHELYYEAEAQGRIRSQPIYFADSATSELEDLGRRLDQVRWIVRCATSDWAKTHWSQVEGTHRRAEAAVRAHSQGCQGRVRGHLWNRW